MEVKLLQEHSITRSTVTEYILVFPQANLDLVDVLLTTLFEDFHISEFLLIHRFLLTLRYTL